MKPKKSDVYTRYAIVLGIGMALGPLAALSLNSLDSEPAVATTDNPLPTYDNNRNPSMDYAGKMLSDVAAGTGTLDFFSTVLQAGEVRDILRGPQQFTVFAPVNAAFSNVGGERLDALLRDPSQVRDLAQAHVVPGRITQTDLMTGMQLESINGHRIAASADANLRVNGATILYSEVAANGIVHYVDNLL